MNSDYDYIVRDSSILPDKSSLSAVRGLDNSIRVGIVREAMETERGIMYSVEVHADGKIILAGCTQMVKFGGAHNFEEYGVRGWAASTAYTQLPTAFTQYKARSGDVVVVAFLNGKSKEGVILGGLSHYAREPKLKKDNIAYLSEFNGIETSIANSGSYKVTFKGYTPADEALLKLPPTGVDIQPPIYNPLTGGSYFGFSDNGSWIASDKSQFIKIHKNIVSGSIILKSGSTQIELGGNPAIGSFSVKAGKSVMDVSTTASIKSTVGLSMQSLQVSIKGTQVAIGNDQFELFDGLIQLIDALGSLVVTSPVGTCTPLMAAPTWAAQVLPLKIKLSLVKGSLKDADSFELAGDDDPTITSSAD
jgi:hypothetical protein